MEVTAGICRKAGRHSLQLPACRILGATGNKQWEKEQDAPLLPVETAWVGKPLLSDDADISRSHVLIRSRPTVIGCGGAKVPSGQSRQALKRQHQHGLPHNWPQKGGFSVCLSVCLSVCVSVSFQTLGGWYLTAPAISGWDFGSRGVNPLRHR